MKVGTRVRLVTGASGIIVEAPHKKWGQSYVQLDSNGKCIWVASNNLEVSGVRTPPKSNG